MGCGSSANTEEPQRKKDSMNQSQASTEYDELMGKRIPKLLVQQTGIAKNDRQDSENSDEVTKNNLNDMLNPKDDNIQRQVKKSNKKIRGGDDQNEQIYENIIKTEKKQSQKDNQMIHKSFKSHFVFFSLSQQAIDQLTSKMFYCIVKKGDTIFQQGDKVDSQIYKYASCYFIIEHGEVEIIINEKQVRILKQGDYFGEIALLYNAPRSATIKALNECGFWVLDRSTFKKCIEELMIKEYDENRKFIDEVSFFSFMTASQRDSIAHTLITNKFQPGQIIVNEGDQADSYFVIKQGEVSIWKSGKQIRTMGQKDSFGEQALYVSSTRGATVKAETEVKCLSLGRDTITQILGDKVQIIIFSNLMRWSFEKSEVLKQLTKVQLEKIASKAKITNFKSGAQIFTQGQQCDKLVIVLEGNLVSRKNETITKGHCFGDAFLKAENRTKAMDSEYVMVGDGVLAILSFSNLFKVILRYYNLLKLIGGDFETVMKKNENSHEKKIQNLGQRADASHIKVEDLIFIKKLGQGQFGWVYLVKHKSIKDKSYALKSISKASIVEQHLERHILQEKQVLEIVNFPFIMQFVRSFKDDISVYFLVEYIRGMELFDVIRDIGLLSKSDTQFYVGTMILALEYLHLKQIVYRDLKPENIMVNDQGYMYLIDLGTAKPLTKGKGYRTYTIIGTPHYMAPEIILGKGYSFSVDIWSLGICMYEFLCGGVPYAEDADDPYEIYEEIMNTHLQFPSFVRDRQSRKIMEQLLSKQPEARLGASFAALKANPWFDDFDWDKLFSRELKPPYVPAKETLISDKDVDKQMQQGKLVVQQIKEEQQAQKIKYRKEMSKDPNWDQDF